MRTCERAGQGRRTKDESRYRIRGERRRLRSACATPRNHNLQVPSRTGPGFQCNVLFGSHKRQQVAYSLGMSLTRSSRVECLFQERVMSVSWRANTQPDPTRHCN
jgi:hypothetical protein